MVDVEATTLREYMHGQTEQSGRRIAFYFVDVGVLNFRAIDDRDRAASDDLQLLVCFQHDRRVFVDADTDQKWVHRDSGKQSSDAMTLSEVLIDDEFSRETKAGREHHEFATRGVSFAALSDHVIADHARAGGRASDDGAVAMRAADRACEFGAAEHRDDAALISAGEKDAGHLFDERELRGIFAIGT